MKRNYQAASSRFNDLRFNDFNEHENDACIALMLLLRERVLRLAFDLPRRSATKAGCKMPRDAEFTLR
ncbi:MAG: hypothetical protein J2P56_06095 [Verrucomicrobia bacterium]|nr:hypothetical protein [Verrucomicrobiota bacterium]